MEVRYWRWKEGAWSPDSQAFNNSGDGSGMSVHLASSVLAGGLSAGDVVPDLAVFGVVALRVGGLRACRQGVIREPEVNDPHHCEVIGSKSSSVRKKIKALWTPVFLPTGLVVPSP